MPGTVCNSANRACVHPTSWTGSRSYEPPGRHIESSSGDDKFPMSLLQKVNPEATEDKKRLTECFKPSRLRGDVLTVGEILAVDIQLNP